MDDDQCMEDRLFSMHKKKMAQSGSVIRKANPYQIRKKGKKFQVAKNSSGRVTGTFRSRKKALKQFNLLEGIHHGWRPTRNK